MNEKELGVVLTPPKTADYIISRLGIILDNQKVLDPCVGPGIFIRALLKSGVKKSQIFCHDINPDYKAIIEDLDVSFKNVDNLLSFKAENYGEYDFIVGNPPYLNKASSYVKNNRAELKKIYGKINAHETYSMFIVNSVWRLKEGGKLGFITSDSFLSLNTHTRLRKFILKSCLINEILLAPKNLFSDQDVSTSPVILILTKCSDEQMRNQNKIRVVPRVENEEEYENPKKVLMFQQKDYHILPFNIFFIDVEREVLNFFNAAPKLENFLKGYIGMHTHDNKKYVAAIEDTKLGKIFRKKNEKIKDNNLKFKIINRKHLDSGKWKPYLKRGGAEQYYRPISEALDWFEESIKVYDIPKNVPFEKEGIVISGVSSRLAARYMPEGCYWDSNKAMGFISKNTSISIEFMLGILNSSLFNYFAKGIINNTSSIQLTGIHALPFFEPDSSFKIEIETQVQKIMNNIRLNQDYNYIKEQKIIDNLIFKYFVKEYNFPVSIKKKLDNQFSIYKLDN
ncbi:MAG: Eco57I restriction-modification methylase domain-containing protein [Candidatus Hermodarchaeota archaeon]